MNIGKVFLAALLAVSSAGLIGLEKGADRGAVVDIVGLPDIRSGDLVFRMGKAFYSDVIRSMGGPDARFSHVGILYVEHGDAYVLHTEVDGKADESFARKERLDRFISEENASSYGFYRVKGLDRGRVSVAVDAALRYVRERVPYDAGLDLRSDDRIYCTELVYKAFLSAGVDLLSRHATPHEAPRAETGVVMPEELLMSENVYPLN